MFIRFITQFKNEVDKIETGVFQACAFLINSEQTYDYDKERLKLIKAWFSSNLDRPDRFSKAKSKNSNNVALSWFKSSATDHIKWMYDLKAVLDRYEIFVEVIKRENPGYIIYEDQFQVATLPHGADKNKVV